MYINVVFCLIIIVWMSFMFCLGKAVCLSVEEKYGEFCSFVARLSRRTGGVSGSMPIRSSLLEFRDVMPDALGESLPRVVYRPDASD